MMRDGVHTIFDQAGCTGALLVQSLGGETEFGLHADELVVPASVIKVLHLMSWSAGASEDQFGTGQRTVADNPRPEPWEGKHHYATRHGHTAPAHLDRRDGTSRRVRTGTGHHGPAVDQTPDHKCVPTARMCGSQERRPLGIVRNEVGVISYPDGRVYAAAVFTRAQSGADDATINAAIGTATARAIASLVLQL